MEQFSESVDVMPTILDLLGRTAPVQCDGFSLTPFLSGRSPRSWRQEAFWELDFRDVPHARAETELKIGLDECSLAVLRGPRFKYVHFAALPPLFFDLEADPDELRNLAADREHAPRVLAYAQKLLSHRLAYADRTLTGMQLTAPGPGGTPANARGEDVQRRDDGVMKRVPEELVEFAGRLADESGAIAMRLFRSGVGFELKADRSPVTIADQQAEAAIRRTRSALPIPSMASSARNMGKIAATRISYGCWTRSTARSRTSRGGRHSGR